MKPVYVTIFILSILLSACNSGSEGDKKQDVATPESVIKTTRQFITNEDGTVTENTINTEIQFYAERISFVFSSKPEQNFELTVTTKEESPSGIKYIVKDKKFTDVFVSSGAEPQVNLNAAYGSTTYM
jgi:hypothetical protein